MSKKYKLSNDKIKALAEVFFLEQGNVTGVKACASHACNYLEKWQKGKYEDPYECVINSGWWGNATSVKQRMNSNNASQEMINGVKDVIVNGNRTLPEYIDEYDWLYDVGTATNNGKAIDRLDRSQYKKDVTKITNVYGSTWTFYCFPDGVHGVNDPFGYISKPAGTIQNNITENHGTIDYNLETVKLGSESASVIILQSILFAEGYVGANNKPVSVDGEAGANTIYALKTYQKNAKLTSDGVCGTKTWQKIIKGLKA